MPCPFYLGLCLGNPLKVCGPRERLGYAPSSTHLRIFCLSISAYNECPNYKLKTTNWNATNSWFRFFKQLFGFFY
jgi:hypothetical protein